MLVQFGNNWIQKIPRTVKLDSASGLVQFWHSSEFFSSNYFQIGQHVVLLQYTNSTRYCFGIVNHNLRSGPFLASPICSPFTLFTPHDVNSIPVHEMPNCLLVTPREAYMALRVIKIKKAPDPDAIPKIIWKLFAFELAPVVAHTS